MALRKSHVQRNLTVIGSIFLNLPAGLDWYWGSVSVYVVSYDIFRQQRTSAVVGAPWIISLYNCGWILGIIASSFISRFLKRRLVILLGCVISNAFMFPGYFLVQSSLDSLSFVVGMGNGFGIGLIYGSSIQLVVHVVEKDVLGFSLALLTASSMGGALVITQIVTWYTNPKNEIPHLEVQSSKYFTQKDIVNRVPSLFFVIPGFSVFLQFIGMALLYANSSMRYFNFCSSKDVSEQTAPDEQAQIVYDCQSKTDSANRIAKHNVGEETVPDHGLIAAGTEDDYTPKKLLRSPRFYFMWISFFILDMPVVLLNNYYKSYGLLWIQDDHFLSNLGTVNILVAFSSRLFWGQVLDKLGPRSCLVLLLSGLSLSVIWLYFAPMIHRWMYFFTLLIFGSFSGGSYSSFLASVPLIFGRTHASTNTGLLLSSALTFNLLAPQVFHVILIHLGWFTLFGGAGAMNMISLLLCLSSIPK